MARLPIRERDSLLWMPTLAVPAAIERAGLVDLAAGEVWEDLVPCLALAEGAARRPKDPQFGRGCDQRSTSSSTLQRLYSGLRLSDFEHFLVSRKCAVLTSACKARRL